MINFLHLWIEPPGRAGDNKVYSRDYNLCFYVHFYTYGLCHLRVQWIVLKKDCCQLSQIMILSPKVLLLNYKHLVSNNRLQGCETLSECTIFWLIKQHNVVGQIMKTYRNQLCENDYWCCRPTKINI